MIIKKFLGKSEQEALRDAQSELGSGVVVMNRKKIRSKGFWGWFGGGQVELTVACEEPTVEVSPRAKAPEEAEGAHRISKKLDGIESMLMQQLEERRAARRQEEGTLLAPAHKEQSIESVAREMASKEKLPEDESELLRFIRLLYNTMLDNEVDEKYANQLLEELEKLNRPNVPMDHTLAGIYQKLIVKLGRAKGITPAKDGPKVVFFIGPTGVGKTTTIAKIAGVFALEEKKKVALLTSDTYRIAATDQLRTYANILETPFRIIYSPEEVAQAVKDFRDSDYIFVDTTGHSQYNEEQLAYTGRMVRGADGVAESQVFLVLSATTKQRDLQRIADNYRSVSDFELIFTKLDETMSLGNLLNIKFYTNAPIAYVASGQNVPDDIESFNPQKTVKQLLGGGNHRV